MSLLLDPLGPTRAATRPVGSASVQVAQRPVPAVPRAQAGRFQCGGPAPGPC